jgi:hypothetical protein
MPPSIKKTIAKHTAIFLTSETSCFVMLKSYYIKNHLLNPCFFLTPFHYSGSGGWGAANAVRPITQPNALERRWEENATKEKKSNP